MKQMLNITVICEGAPNEETEVFISSAGLSTLDAYAFPMRRNKCFCLPSELESIQKGSKVFGGDLS